MTNPLLDFTDLPLFADIKPEHVAPAIDHLLTQCHAEVERLTKNPTQSEAKNQLIEWDQFVIPLENVTEKLGRAWGIVSHLNSVVDTPALRAAYNDNQQKITEFWTELGQNLALFNAYKQLRAQPSFATLTPARQKIVENALRDFKLSGADLLADEKVRYAQIQEKLAALSTKFSENVLDATNHYSLLITDINELKGIPSDVIQAAKNAAEEAGKVGYQFNLHFPSFYPILQYADNRELRKTLYRANVTKASELGDNPAWDNSAIIDEILALRLEEAQLLGYDNFAQVSLQPKMADSPEQVSQFLLDLAHRARPFAEKDLQEIRQFAKEHDQIEPVEAWDFAYLSEKCREQRYAFSEQELKLYFPEQKVVSGLFQVTEKLFSVRILLDQAETWHPDVKFYRVEKDGQLIGQFYLDLYARNGKQGGAWMDDARGRRRTATGIQTPVAYLTCNFSQPITHNGITKPATFTHDEVITLFHEFGHGLHHLLTKVEDLSVSGISGVEWDAVELPSQFLENFCWEWDVLQQMTSHVETGASLPKTLYDKMIAAKNFQAGLQTLRQVEFALFDMQLHDNTHKNLSLPTQEKVAAILKAVKATVAVMPSPEFSRQQHSFSHIFAGGYSAGYFSYKWAEVLSADAYAAFEEAKKTEGSAVSEKMGAQFQKEILEMGGSRPAMLSFCAFRGREPSIDALLRHNGMTENKLSTHE